MKLGSIEKKIQNVQCASVDCTLGIPEIEQAPQNYQPIPNPARDEINVSINTQCQEMERLSVLTI